jgi:hypothetical protein
VEGTMSQFKRKTRDGKLRIRLTNRIRNAVVLMAIGINFGRLLAYYRENQPGLFNLLASLILLLMCMTQKIRKNLNYIGFHPALVNNPVFC